jgi:hypothetical protein
METSYFLAQIFAATFATIGLGLILHPKYYHKVFKQFMKEEALYLFGGMMTIPAGIALVMNHNLWDGPWWVTVISVLCWIVLVKGIFLLIAPEWMQKTGKKWLKNKSLVSWIGILYFIFGLIFGYYGFFY